MAQTQFKAWHTARAVMRIQTAGAVLIALLVCPCILLPRQLQNAGEIEPAPVAKARSAGVLIARPLGTSAHTLPAALIAPSARSLVRNGALYLSLKDALALAIENNLDVQVARYGLSIARTNMLRAQGGGSLRQVDNFVAESPTGVGGPGSPLLNSAAATLGPTTPTVNDLTSLNILKETETAFSLGFGQAFAPGAPVPVFDASIIGQTSWFQRSNTPILGVQGGTGSVPSHSLNFLAANYAFVQGFSSGAQIEVDLNNTAQALYGSRGNLNPFSTPNTSITVTQPLLRGSGRAINLRFLKISANDQKISRLAFYQQLTSTVYGVARLYYDFVSLNENLRVKRATLDAAQVLYADNSAQVKQGTLPPAELARSQALLASAELDAIQAEGLMHQQEIILKSQVARQGTADRAFGNLPIVPTDGLSISEIDEIPPLERLVSEALSNRPDLVAAALEVQSGTTAVAASRNATRPQIDLIANYQTRGSTLIPFDVLGTGGDGLIVTPPGPGVAGLPLSQIFQAGIQVRLPLRNRVAQADAARDLLLLRQAETRTQRLANEVREEVENSLIAFKTARSALAAAIQSREYQQNLAATEKSKLSFGASTKFLVIQQQSYVAQAQSTEVAARNICIKAQLALDRAVGDLLEKNGIAFDLLVGDAHPATPGGS
jgi:outer membrane protein